MVPPDDDSEDRAAILRRRAVFVMSAVAGIGIAACSDDPKREREPSDTEETATSASSRRTEPQPCLNIVQVPPEPPDGGVTDAGPTTSADAGLSASADAGVTKVPPKRWQPPPRPCLKALPPDVCLYRFAPPIDDDDP